MGVIYVRPNLFNGKKYVGQTTDLKVRQREWNNLNKPYAGVLINRARAKYGPDSFGFEILKECKDEELDHWEMYYIEKLDTKAPNGYNMTEGGGGMHGYVPSEETRRKLSEANKGEKHWCYGKPLSDETKRKISETQKGKTHTKETKRKMSETHTGEKNPNYGKPMSEEQKRKISETKKGKKLSEEAKRKISESLINGKSSKAVLQCDLDGNIITEFPSVNEVQRQLGFKIGNISHCCNGKFKSAYGYKWSFK